MNAIKGPETQSSTQASATAGQAPAPDNRKKTLLPYSGYYSNKVPAHDPELTELRYSHIS